MENIKLLFHSLNKKNLNNNMVMLILLKIKINYIGKFFYHLY